MDEAEKTLEAYDKLFNEMPSIGFINRKKRVMAFLKVTKYAQHLIDKEEISEENALYLLSIMVRKHAPFQKAAMMTALNLPNIDRKAIKSIGFKYANEMRCNMQMYPVDDSNLTQAEE